MSDVRVLATVLVTSFVGGCATHVGSPPGSSSSTYVLNSAVVTPAAGDFKVFWRSTIMLADVRSIDWKDVEWAHMEGPKGYARERTGPDVDIAVTRLDGKVTVHKVRKSELVASSGGELRLP